MKKIWNILNIIIAVGVLALINTAGASDMEKIPFGQALQQVMVAIALIIAGLVGKGILVHHKKATRRKQLSPVMNTELRRAS